LVIVDDHDSGLWFRYRFYSRRRDHRNDPCPGLDGVNSKANLIQINVQRQPFSF